MSSFTKLFVTASLTSLAALGAHAETYEGVHAPVGQNARATVAAQAVGVAAEGATLYGDAAGQGVQAPTSPVTDRAAIRAQAVAAAHNPTANLDAKAFVNSRIPDQYAQGSLARNPGRLAQQTQR